MTDCPTCGHPMVWSTETERQWCSVYGTHAQRPRGQFAGLVRLCMDAEDEDAGRARLRVVA